MLVYERHKDQTLVIGWNLDRIEYVNYGNQDSQTIIVKISHYDGETIREFIDTAAFSTSRSHTNMPPVIASAIFRAISIDDIMLIHWENSGIVRYDVWINSVRVSIAHRDIGLFGLGISGLGNTDVLFALCLIRLVNMVERIKMLV